MAGVAEQGKGNNCMSMISHGALAFGKSIPRELTILDSIGGNGGIAAKDATLAATEGAGADLSTLSLAS